MPTTLGQRLTRAREHAHIKQKDVAEHFGISSQAISQWEADRTRPDSQRLSRLARLFAVRIEWLLDESGPMIFDGAQADTEVRHTARVPVIDLVQAGNWTEVDVPLDQRSSDEFLQTDLGLSSNAFALVIAEPSMEPEFRPGDKVIIDPMVQPRPGDFIVAKREADREATFKRYRLRSQDDDGYDVIELKPANPDWPSLTMDRKNPGRIIGTMVEHRRYRRG
ncbi:MAG: XRE family transcriptional regulator [Kiloniellales bacterium]|nr:XRE family transcriptional regulator [Kiloniellales bacterium]